MYTTAVRVPAYSAMSHRRGLNPRILVRGPAAIGAERDKDSVRLFMAPGVNHCAGGEGTFQIDALDRSESATASTRSTEPRAARSGPSARFGLYPRATSTTCATRRAIHAIAFGTSRK